MAKLSSYSYSINPCSISRQSWKRFSLVWIFFLYVEIKKTNKKKHGDRESMIEPRCELRLVKKLTSIISAVPKQEGRAYCLPRIWRAIDFTKQQSKAPLIDLWNVDCVLREEQLPTVSQVTDCGQVRIIEFQQRVKDQVQK